MRAPMRLTVLLAVMVLASFSLVAAQGRPNVWVEMSEVEGLIEVAPGDWRIPAAGLTTMRIPIHVQNVDIARTAISNGYIFEGDITWWALNAVWTEDYPVNETIACDVFNCCEKPPFPQLPCYSWFDFSTDIVYINPDLTTGDNFTGVGVGLAGLTGQGSGLPADFNDVLYTIEMWTVAGAEGATMTMDTTYWLPSNYWTWSGCGENVDWGGGPDGYVFRMEGGPIGTPPVVAEIPDQEGVEGAAFAYTATITEGDLPIEWSLAGADFLTIDPSTGAITGELGDPDVYTVTVTATNAAGFDDEVFVLTVTPAPVAPIVADIPDQAGTTGDAFNYTATITEGDLPITWDIDIAGPANFLDIDAGGNITGTLGAPNVYTVTVTATNAVGSDDEEFVLTVNDLPYVAPVIADIPDQAVFFGATFEYDVEYAVVGYPVPTFSLTSGPSTMDIDPVSGEITWVVDEETPPTVTVRAENAAGYDEKSFEITVSTTCDPYIAEAIDNPAAIDMGTLGDRKFWVHINCAPPKAEVDLASFRILNIPNYENGGVAYYDDANSVISSCAYVMRFLGAGGFRPLPSVGYPNATAFDVSYELVGGGDPVHFTGYFVLELKVGDVNLDGNYNIDDLVFMTDYFFRQGEMTNVDNQRFEEIMDVDQSGRIDLLDVNYMIRELGL